MARLNKTIQDYQEQLKNKGIKDIPKFIQAILDADITKGKYSRFLLDCYLNDKFREEDLIGGLESTIGISVALFHKHKSKLSKDMRSVYKYETPGDLWNAVKQYDGELSGKELKKELQDKIYAETEFLYEDENTGFKIISPLSEDAAKWWGRGTRWCTSAEKNNMFKTYVQQSPLLILLMPDGKKYQAWKSPHGRCQFMDELDNNLMIEDIEKEWEYFRNIIIYLSDFNYLPESKINDCIFEFTNFFKDYNNMKKIKEEFMTEDIYQNFLKYHKEALLYYPERNLEKIKEMIILGEIDIGKLNEKYYTNLFIKNVFESRMRNLNDKIPDDIKNIYNYMQKNNMDDFKQEHFNILFKIDKKILLSFSDFVKEHHFKEFIHSKMVTLLEYPEFKKRFEKFYTPENCKYALWVNNQNVIWIPKEYINEDVVAKIVKNNPEYIRYLPEKYYVEENIIKSIQKNEYTLKFIPEHLQTEKMALASIRKSKSSEMYIRSDLIEKLENEGYTNGYKPYITITDVINDYNEEFFIENSDLSLFKELPESLWTDNLYKNLILSLIRDPEYIIKINQNEDVFNLVNTKMAKYLDQNESLKSIAINIFFNQNQFNTEDENSILSIMRKDFCLYNDINTEKELRKEINDQKIKENRLYIKEYFSNIYHTAIKKFNI